MHARRFALFRSHFAFVDRSSRTGLRGIGGRLGAGKLFFKRALGLALCAGTLGLLQRFKARGSLGGFFPLFVELVELLSILKCS
ncbi:hypothetical protein EGYY_22290 [Eggerthella sp. YY7918]|nr:hypothetical protein EGYY_22290 [Eggerthella sp. YY7918]